MGTESTALPPAASGRIDAGTALTVHLVLLLIVPSNLTIAGLAAYGRPSLIWGLMLLAWWVIWQLQSASGLPGKLSDPVRVSFMCLVVIILLSFAAALLRGDRKSVV